MLQTRVAEEPSRYRLNRLAGEVSRFNPDAIRGPHGIWNEETLPVLEWEAAEYRVVVPAWLQAMLKIDFPVLRWSSAKRSRVLVEHADVAPYVANLTEMLDRIAWAGREPGRPPTWRMMFRDEGRWFQVVVGEDKLGRTNMITVYQLRPNQVLGNMSCGWMRPCDEK